jgi:hypothetical protein
MKKLDKWEKEVRSFEVLIIEKDDLGFGVWCGVRLNVGFLWRL